MLNVPNIRKGPFITSRVPLDIDAQCSFQEAWNMAELIKFFDDEKEKPVEYFLERTEGNRAHGMYVLSCPARKDKNGESLQFPLGLMIHDCQQDFRLWAETVKKTIADHMLP